MSLIESIDLGDYHWPIPCSLYCCFVLNVKSAVCRINVPVLPEQVTYKTSSTVWGCKTGYKTPNLPRNASAFHWNCQIFGIQVPMSKVAPDWRKNPRATLDMRFLPASWSHQISWLYRWVDYPLSKLSNHLAFLPILLLAWSTESLTTT